MRKLLTFAGLLLGLAAQGQIAERTNSPIVLPLTWDRSPDQVDGYRLYWGVASRTYTNVVTIGDTNVIVVGQGAEFERGVSYYFTVTAFVGGQWGGESDYSNEITLTFPRLPGAPKFLRLYVSVKAGVITLQAAAPPDVAEATIQANDGAEWQPIAHVRPERGLLEYSEPADRERRLYRIGQ